jgi:long-chain fatty acid transport protein
LKGKYSKLQKKILLFKENEEFFIMKKSLFAVFAATSLLFAESYQVNTLSAKQLGMAHTGAGITTLGAEAMHFNPGGLGFLGKTLDISAGATFIIPNVEFFGNGGKATNTTLGTPLYVYAASTITDWFSAGLSFTTPYGNTVDYGDNSVLADLLQDISLAVYTLQPTVAFKPISQLSFGGGPTINFGSFSQSKRVMIKEGQLNPLFGITGVIKNTFTPGFADPEVYEELKPYIDGIESVAGKYAVHSESASAKFEGDADVAVGFHLGALYEILPNKLSLGVSYRSEVEMKVAKGKAKGAEVIAADMAKLNEAKAGLINAISTQGYASTFPDLDRHLAKTPFPEGDFEASLPLPSNMNFGLSMRPIDNLLLAFDFQWIGWGAYDKLVLAFDDALEITSLKKYHDAFAYRFGAQYTLIDQLDIRCGMYFDESPVDDEYLTPESPSTSKIAGTIGLSFRPMPNLSIDAALLRSVSISGRDATSGSDEAKEAGKTDGINGRYEVVAWAPSIGLSFSF